MTVRGHAAWRGLRVVGGLVGSTASYYGLRATGLGVAPALVVVALVSAVPVVVGLARGVRPRGLAAFYAVLVLAAAVVALVPGDARFLLARESALTAAAGVWFLLSTRTARPLAYQFARPLAEGRLGWPRDWERLWATSSAFRRMWRTSSTVWGIGTLADAVLRVVLAYRLPPDRVPAASLGLFAATAVLLNVVTSVYYAACGAFDRRGPFHSPAAAP